MSERYCTVEKFILNKYLYVIVVCVVSLKAWEVVFLPEGLYLQNYPKKFTLSTIYFLREYVFLTVWVIAPCVYFIWFEMSEEDVFFTSTCLIKKIQ